MRRGPVIGLAMLLGIVLAVSGASAATNCSFTVLGNTWSLDSDCWTDSTIAVPDGVTLDGQGRTITAVDPVGGFTGAVVGNAGATAYVRHVTITASTLANLCKGGADRLRGIMFEGASGAIEHNTILGINKGPSGCQEGNGIEVRNAPFDGTHPNTQTVTLAHNTVLDYQKTGFVANGDVDVVFRNNTVGGSATQANLAGNAIQLGFGARGTIRNNKVGGNSWCGPSNYVATSVLLYLCDGGSVVESNHINGDSDVGVYILCQNIIVSKNHVSDGGNIDCNVNGYDYDYGLVDSGTGNSVTKNKVWNFDTPYDGVTGGKNKSKDKPNPKPGPNL